MTDDNKEQDDQPWPVLPVPLQHRLSMKWATMESLRIIQSRLKARGQSSKVLLLTTIGPVQGELADITDSYEASVGAERVSEIDAASAAAHLRTELWSMYTKTDKQMEPIDSGALIHVRNANVRLGARRLQVPHLALFADDVVGFTLISNDVM